MHERLRKMAVAMKKRMFERYRRGDISIFYDNFSRENAMFMDEIADELENALSLRDGHEFLGYQKEFEAQCASYLGTPYAMGLSSGTAALSFALRALGVGCGDQVITTPHTYVATALAISDVGAVPRFVDIKDDFSIDPAMIDKQLAGSAKAVIPVHIYGAPCSIEEISAIGKQFDLAVIEDCCQAFGATVNNRKVGTFGDAGCFSFHPSKIVGGLGDGGMVITRSPCVSKQIDLLREPIYDNKAVLKSLRTPASLDVIHIPFLKVKLRHIDEIIEKKKAIADVYNSALAGIPGIVLPFISQTSQSVLRNFTLRAKDRDRLVRFLISQGIEAKVFYDTPLHLRNEFAHLGYKRGDFPVCEKLYREIISLPISYSLNVEDVQAIVKEVRRFYEG